MHRITIITENTDTPCTASALRALTFTLDLFLFNHRKQLPIWVTNQIPPPQKKIQLAAPSMQLRMCAKCVKVTQLMGHLRSFQNHGKKPPSRLIERSEILYLNIEFRSCWGEKPQWNVVMENRATLLPFWPKAVALQLFLIWQTAPSICETGSTNTTTSTHPKFPTSPLITIQCLISGFIWENSGLALDVAFTVDKIHDRSPEALCLMCCKRNDICLLFPISGTEITSTLRRHADLLQVRERKCGNQNRTQNRTEKRTQALAIKVNSLKEYIYARQRGMYNWIIGKCFFQIYVNTFKIFPSFHFHTLED